jgi:predicted metalloprotease with PDZ domain
VSRLPVHYRIRPANPTAHLFEVSVTVEEPDPAGQRLSMPAWIPGSYMIRDFARCVLQLWAQSAGQPIETRKLDKDTWLCAPCGGPITVCYQVYARDLSVRAAYLDTVRGYFNGTSVFLTVDGRRNEPCRVDIEPPEGESYAQWRVATSMTPAGALPFGFGRYRAEDYDDLVDHPVEMGVWTMGGFEAGGVPHDIVVTGRHRADIERLCRDVNRICGEHIRLFGELPPIGRYVFLLSVVGDGYGGLEHRASCSLLCSRDSLPRKGETELSEGYRRLLGLISHEYFHLWNVKRIRPRVFVPYDLSRENYTRMLWAFEGITSYYDDLALVRSRLVTRESYLELLGQTVTRVLRGSGRSKQSLAESSFDAWTKFYRQDESAPNTIVSYYAKGALLALALDLKLRTETAGQENLDHVMRGLWERYGKSEVGVPEDGVERLAGEISGLDLGPFFDASVRGTEDLPLEALLAGVGVEWHLRPADSQEDKGGKPAARADEKLSCKAVLGVRLAGDTAEAKLANVFDGGGAQEAGLAAGDVVVAVDSIRATAANLERLVGGYPPGVTVPIHAFRRDELMSFEVTLKSAAQDTCFLTLKAEVDDATRARREAWLGG